MNLQLKAKIEQAIDKVIQDNAQESLWDGYIHPEISRQMADAAEAVFDSAISSQNYVEKEMAT